MTETGEGQDGRGQGHLTLMLVPDGGRESRSVRLSHRAVRLSLVFLALLGLAFVVMAGSWWYLAARATRVADLEREVAALRADNARIGELARQLQDVEERYQRVRGMFGPGPTAGSPGVWLPPAGRGGRLARPSRDEGATRPESWPLTEPGYVTQGLLDAELDHPGVDIAVPTASYVRASGGGMVVDAGEDPVYGNFVVIDHGEGYSSLYGHASMILVERGQRVRRDEVIALSGSTGRSTAPHLHFEILLDGEAVDPLSLVTQP